MQSNQNVVCQKELQDEMIGILTAISIVSKRLASRLSILDSNDSNKKENGGMENEQNKVTTRCCI